TLHPTPYTLHPTPYTLPPTPCTLHPTPYTLHPTPYTLHPAPDTHTQQTLNLKPYTRSHTPRRAGARRRCAGRPWRSTDGSPSRYRHPNPETRNPTYRHCSIDQRLPTQNTTGNILKSIIGLFLRKTPKVGIFWSRYTGYPGLACLVVF
ncbi:hypothetical protein T484DRAFT_1648361, partial [Baffinella frigidus]